MSADKQRSTVSKKSPYYVERHRYLELRQFCLQYDLWAEKKNRLYSLSTRQAIQEVLIKRHHTTRSHFLEALAERLDEVSKSIELVDKALEQCDPVIAPYLKKGLTKGVSFATINAMERIPCSKDYYYNQYRRFFWVLNSIRDSDENLKALKHLNDTFKGDMER